MSPKRKYLDIVLFFTTMIMVVYITYIAIFYAASYGSTKIEIIVINGNVDYSIYLTQGLFPIPVPE